MNKSGQTPSVIVKPGYKHTEVGVIPLEWEVAQFGSLIEYTKGYAFQSREYSSDGIRVVRVSDTSYDSILETNPVFVPESKGSQYSKWRLKADDLIISTVGSKPPMYDSMVGKVILVHQQNEGALLNQNAVLVRDKKRRKYLQQILLNHFRTKRYLIWIESIFRGNANQASITLKDLFDFSVPIPASDAEQRAIAGALSDVDALLGALDQITAKKRDLKQAAMQQLLTGQTRLPGFHGEWETKRLKTIIQIPVTDGPHLTPKFLDDGIPFLSVNNLVGNKIDLGELRFISQVDHEIFSRKCKPRKDDILLGKAASVGKVAIVDLEIEFNIWSPIALIRINGDNIPRFVYYQLQSTDLIGQITLLTNSSSQGNIGMGDIEKLALKLPPLPEQTAIAEMLTDMDAELAALEQRRAKTRALKQGMMQELLTGRTRLV